MSAIDANTIDGAIWSRELAPQAVAELSSLLGLERVEPSRCPDHVALERWLDWAGRSAGFELEQVSLSYSDAVQIVSHAAPCVVTFDDDSLLVLLSGERDSVQALATDGAVVSLPLDDLVERITRATTAEIEDGVDAILDRAELSGRPRERARRAMLETRAGDRHVGNVYLARLPVSERLAPQLKELGARRRVAMLVVSYLLYQAAWLASWFVIGTAALGGRLDFGWLAAWVLLLFSLVPLKAAATWLEGRLSIDLGTFLKARLIYGALVVDRDRVARAGAGSFMGQVIESDTVERSLFAGGTQALFAAVELGLAISVLAVGAGGALHVAIAVAIAALAAVLVWRYLDEVRRATAARLDLTHTVIDSMIGHRTRLVQGDPREFHGEEDRNLSRYIELTERADRTASWLIAAVPRLWVVLASAALALSVWGGASASAMAIAIGGMLLLYRAFVRLAYGASELVRCRAAWDSVSEIYRAAETPVPVGDVRSLTNPEPDAGPLLELRGVSFRYPGSETPVLSDVDLTIDSGARILVEGPSGSGKSTLAAILAGLREADQGLCLAAGLDLATLGPEGWRRLVVTAPQFQENHILVSNLAFNLLMGRRWPPRKGDPELAYEICEDLGLGPLLERMPGGLGQPVGEIGWQLSHGERSRIFIARALLQEAPVIVLDESFAALDPETVALSVAAVRKRAKAVITIAHP